MHDSANIPSLSTARRPSCVGAPHMCFRACSVVWMAAVCAATTFMHWAPPRTGPQPYMTFPHETPQSFCGSCCTSWGGAFQGAECNPMR